MFSTLAFPAFAEEADIPFDYDFVDYQTDGEYFIDTPINGGGLYVLDDLLEAPQDFPTRDVQWEDFDGGATGYAIETFNLTSATTRGRAAAYIVMARDATLFNGAVASNRFSDVSMDRWEFPAITWAANRQWILGLAGTNRFNPDANVTRQEYAAMLVRAFSTPLHSGTQLDRFSDRAQIATWAVPYVRRAVERGWIQGFPDGTFRPLNNITRQDAITMTNRTSGRNISDPTIRTITWNGNGGTNPTQWQRIQGHAIGILPTASWTNHTFDGWFNTASLGGGTQTTATTITPNSNVTYWARWWIWHSDANTVAFWPGTGAIHARAYELGTVSGGFNFGTRVAEARTAWAGNLGRTINAGGTTATAHILAFGGTRTEIERRHGNFAPLWAGVAVTRVRNPAERTIVINGINRTIHQRSGQAEVYVVQRWTGATWTQDQINRTRQVTVHELGHALGYSGHSPNLTANNQDVMWATNTPHFALRPNEIRHLAQVYARHR